MNLLNRVISSFISVLPSGIPGAWLIYYAWNLHCDDIRCKAMNVALMLTGAVLAGWALLVFALCLIEEESSEEYDAWKRFRTSLLDVTPRILFHAVIAGIMLYCCTNLIPSNLDTMHDKAFGGLYLVAVFVVPVYELTRILERRKSVQSSNEKEEAPVSWQTYAGIYGQTLVSFGIWYGIMLLLLENKSLLTDHISDSFWHTSIILGLMTGITYLLMKVFSKAEAMLREKELISWNSSYF